MDWHDKTCHRLDEARVGTLVSCLSCGSCGQAEPRQSTSETTNAIFSYSPIEQRTELRLLSIHPGEFEEPVRCEIFTSDVTSTLYEAISYTWADESGDSSKTGSILVDSTPFSVTRNCEMALKRVRRRLSTRCVWIDSVCINQANIDERGHQVRLMPRIYSGAKTVLIYLGEAADDSSSILRLLANNSWDLDLLAARNATCRLLSRRYFSRVWVLQEIALAKKAVLMCGDTTVPWECLEPERLCSLSLLRGVANLLDGSRIPPALYFDHRVYSQPDQFLNLLDFASGCLAEDGRDKVYSLLGLVLGPQSQGLEADYNLDLGQVYLRTAISLGHHYGWGPVFNHAIGRKSKLLDVPSWVPDWRMPRLSKSKLYEGPSTPKPLGVDFCKITFRGVHVSGVMRSGSSPKVAGCISLNKPGGFVRAEVLHLLNSDICERTTFCFMVRSSIFNFLEPKVRGWKYITTKPLLGVHRDRSTYPFSTAGTDCYELCGAYDSVSLEDAYRWAYLPAADHRASGPDPYDTHMSFEDLVRMVTILEEGLKGFLEFPEGGAEWDFVTGIHSAPVFPMEDMDFSYVEVTLGSLKNGLAGIIARIRKISTGEVSWLAPDAWTASRMADELLKANFKLELRDVFIV